MAGRVGRGISREAERQAERGRREGGRAIRGKEGKGGGLPGGTAAAAGSSVTAIIPRPLTCV